MSFWESLEIDLFLRFGMKLCWNEPNIRSKLFLCGSNQSLQVWSHLLLPSKFNPIPWNLKLVMRIYRVSTIRRAFVTLVNKAPWLQAVYKAEASLSSLSRSTTGGDRAIKARRNTRHPLRGSLKSVPHPHTGAHHTALDSLWNKYLTASNITSRRETS